MIEYLNHLKLKCNQPKDQVVDLKSQAQTLELRMQPATKIRSTARNKPSYHQNTFGFELGWDRLNACHSRHQSEIFSQHPFDDRFVKFACGPQIAKRILLYGPL